MKAEVMYITKGDERQDCDACGKTCETGAHWVGLKYEGEDITLEGCYGSSCVKKFKVGEVVDPEKLFEK